MDLEALVPQQQSAATLTVPESGRVRDQGLRKTTLYDAHLALGGRIVPFAGFAMPVQYASILAEHDAVRKRAGLFDLSHMAQFELRGSDVASWADELTCNSISSMKPYQARYNIFTNQDGGAHDDVIFYRLPDRWLLVVNAGNAEKMFSLLKAALRGNVVITDCRESHSLIAVQGPRSLAILAVITESDLASMKYYTSAEIQIDGIFVVIARTGYTGEDGFEIFVRSEDAARLWDLLLERGRTAGLAACGLGSRDVLRLEAGMPLYGHELAEDITPIQAGLAWAVKFSKPEFTGRNALEAQKTTGPSTIMVGLVLDSRVPVRSGYPVFDEAGDLVGTVCSGSIAPSCGSRSIGTALLRVSATGVGTRLHVSVRDVPQAATVVQMPFYKRELV